MIALERKEILNAQANYLRKQAEPVWEVIEDHGRDRRAFESSLSHFEQQRLCITVMGEFNTGKSTLLNTFIGEELLVTDQLECTATPTWVRWVEDERYEEHRQATVIYANGDSEAMPLSEVSAYTTLDQDFWEEIERVEITLPQPIDEGERGPTDIVLVDTPGLNGNEELEARSIHQLGMSHVTIVVVPVDGIGRKSDVDLIKKARSIADRVMVVINKCDQHAKTGDGFERFREELRKRVPDLPHEAIYTLSAKRAFEGNIYRDGEEELENQFHRFCDDLRNAFDDPIAALQKRPLLLLREICKKEIARIEKLEAECDTSIVRELEAAAEHIKEAHVNLQRSREEILRLSEKTLMGEVSIFQRFLNEERSHIEREMMKFVDELDDELLNQDDLRAARQYVSKWLNESMQSSIFNRVSSLLKAAADRLIYDLESRGQDFALNLPKVASIKLDMTPLKDHADKASEELRRRGDEIDGLKREVARCEAVVKMRMEKVEKLGLRSAQLENLEAQRKQAVKNRRQLGPKPNPKVEDYTAYEDKKVWRGGFGGRRKGIRDWFLGPKIEQIKVTRQRKNYSRVRKWERKFKAADKKVKDLDKKMKPLKKMRKEIQKIKGELPKFQREANNTKAKLRRAEARLLEEQEKYRQAKIKDRQAQLKTGARRELENLFDSLPNRLERKAEQMLKGISKDFIVGSKEVADRQYKSRADEMAQKKKEAYEADAERVKREGVRKTLAEALETFLSEDQGVRK